MSLQVTDRVLALRRRTVEKKRRDIERMCKGVGLSPLDIHISDWAWNELRNTEVATLVDKKSCYIFLKPERLAIIEESAQVIFNSISDGVGSVGAVILDYLDYTSVRCKKCCCRKLNQAWLCCDQCDRPLNIHAACVEVSPISDFHKERCRSCVLICRPCTKCRSYVKRSEWTTCGCKRLDHKHCQGEQSEDITNCKICHGLVHVACCTAVPPSIESACHVCFRSFFLACMKCEGVFLKSGGEVTICTKCNVMFHNGCDLHEECINLV